MFVTLEGFRL